MKRPEISRFASDPVIAVLRAPFADRMLAVSEVLYDAGVRNIEITLTTEGALGALAKVQAALPEDAHVGAGSIRTADDIAASIHAGACYLVSPHVRLDLIEAAQAQGVPMIPGAFTPSEIVAAWEAGAAMVKVFPASVAGGPDYFKQLLGPLPELKLMPSGGIEIDDIATYLKVGAVSVGLGGPLIGDAALPGGDLAALRNRAQRAVAAAAAR